MWVDSGDEEMPRSAMPIKYMPMVACKPNHIISLRGHLHPMNISPLKIFPLSKYQISPLSYIHISPAIQHNKVQKHNIF